MECYSTSSGVAGFTVTASTTSDSSSVTTGNAISTPMEIGRLAAGSYTVQVRYHVNATAGELSVSKIESFGSNREVTNGFDT